MWKHPFRLAIESGASADEFRKLFAADAIIYAPILTKPVKGAQEVLNIIGHAAKLAGPITYTLEVRDSKQTFLLWKGHARGFALEAVTILVDGEDGLIREVRVLMRPWPVVTLFRDAMYRALRIRSKRLLGIAAKARGRRSAPQIHADWLEADHARAGYGAAQSDAGEISPRQGRGRSRCRSCARNPECLILHFDHRDA